VGGWFHGTVIDASAPENLVVNVAGTAYTISLSGNFSTGNLVVTAINMGMSPDVVATYDLVSNSLTLTSQQMGANTGVSIDDASGVNAKLFFGTGVEVDGTDDTSGTYIGECVPHRRSDETGALEAYPGQYDPGTWTGFDFTTSPESMIVVVDGTPITITLDTDVTDIDAAVAALNTGLGKAATATRDSHQYIHITSATTGPGSSVTIGSSSGPKAKQMVSPIVKSVLAVDVILSVLSSNLADTFDPAQDLVFIVERGTGFFIAENANEGIDLISGDRKCVTAATNSLIQEAATIMENVGFQEASAVIDDSHILEAKVFQRDPTVDGFGLDWLIVLVRRVDCPAGQFLAQGVGNSGCVTCEQGKISGDGKVCQVCPTRQFPNVAQSACESCLGNQIVNTELTECDNCPPNMEANEDRCQCERGFYDTTTGVDGCHAMNYSPLLEKSEF
jgi:hypothetical protein